MSGPSETTCPDVVIGPALQTFPPFPLPWSQGGVLLFRSPAGKAAAATNLPLYITRERAITVFLMTLAMCAISALLAVRKVGRLDPAEVF